MAVRYPRGCEEEVAEGYNIEYSDYDFFKNKNDSLIISYGRLYNEATFAAEKTGSSLLKLCKVFPLDIEIIKKALQYKNI